MIAISLGEKDTDLCLEKLNMISQKIDLAEICLDLMDEFHLKRLISESPCPLIISYRPTREGGAYSGDENKRIEILKEAIYLSVAYVDIEWDSINKFDGMNFGSTKIILSRHWFNNMPELLKYYDGYKHHADIIKLVGMPKELSDVLKVFLLLEYADTPVIAIGMGDLGQITRILAPFFGSCFLTFGCTELSECTAPGQLSIEQMLNEYYINHICNKTHVLIELLSNYEKEGIKYFRDSGQNVGEELNIGLNVFTHNLHEIKGKLTRYFNVISYS